MRHWLFSGGLGVHVACQILRTHKYSLGRGHFCPFIKHVWGRCAERDRRRRLHVWTMSPHLSYSKMIIKCVLRLIRSITMTTSSCEKGSLYVWRALWTISSLQKFRLTTKFLMERNNQDIPMFHECSTFCLPPKMRQFLEDSVWIRSSAWFVWNEILQMCILNDDYKKTIVSDTKASNVNPVERRITVLSVCVLLGKGKRPWPYESVWIEVKRRFGTV